VSSAIKAVGSFIGGPGAAVGSAVLGGLTSGRAAGQLGAGFEQGVGLARGATEQAQRQALQQFAPTLADIRMGRDRAISNLREGFGQAISTLQPTAQIGGQALSSLAALSGARGREAQAQAFQGFTESPEQQFIRQQAEQSVLRQSAATGGLGGARVLEALQERGAGLAAQDIQNRFGRLAGVAQFGLPAQANIAQLQSALGQQRAGIQERAFGQLAGARERFGARQAGLTTQLIPAQLELLRGQAQARAGGTLGIGRALQGGVGQLAQLGVFGG
jgi:hypothetical protein